MSVLLTSAALLGGLAGAVHLRARARERQAEAAYPPEGQMVTVDGRQLHVITRGTQGPDLMLIHGLSGNARDFTLSLADRLAADFRVLIVDRPGMGHSEALAGDNSIRAQARALQQVATQMGAARPILLGQSYGGAVALAWAVHHPDHVGGLVLLGAPTHPVEVPLPLHYRLNAHPMLNQLSAPLITALVPEARITRELAEIFAPQTPPEGYADHVGAPLTLRRAALRINAAHRKALTAELATLAPHYATLKLPIEVLHGDRDDIVSLDLHARPLVETAQNAALVPLPGIGHMPHHVAPDQVIAALHRVAARSGLR